jgi:trigger factor
VRRAQQGVEARDKVLEALLGTVDVPLPESVVEAELNWRQQSASEQLQQSGMTLDQYLEREGKGEEQWAAELREGAEQAVKAQLVLDAIADKEELGVTDAELTEQVVRRAQRAEVAPDEYAQQIVQSGQLPGLVSEVRRGKALATVLEAAKITDSAGAEVDLEALREAIDTPSAQVEVDDEGRRYHLHDDGTVHYLDEV